MLKLSVETEDRVVSVSDSSLGESVDANTFVEQVQNLTNIFFGYHVNLYQAVVNSSLESTDPCNWKYDEDDDCYYTSCNRAFMLTNGGVKDNKYTFCPNCSNRIAQV